MRSVLVFLASVGVVVAAACGGKVVVDTTGTGGAGGAQTTSSVTSATSATVGPMTAGTGPTTATGPTMNCQSCNSLLTSGANGEVLCGTSQGLFEALRTCACSSGGCLTQCAGSLCNSMATTQSCFSCLMGSCPSQLSTCSND